MEAVQGYVFDLLNFYDRLWELRDPRVENLPLMSGPLPTVLICLTYVYVVTVWGPNFMRDRKPIEIRDGVNANPTCPFPRTLLFLSKMSLYCTFVRSLTFQTDIWFCAEVFNGKDSPEL